MGVFNPLFNEFGILCEPRVIHNQPLEIQVHSVAKPKGTNATEPKQIYKTEVLHNVSMEFTFIDVETGESKTIPWVGTGNNGIEQGYGSALTYAQRYFLLSYFNVPVDKEDPNYVQTIKAQGEKTVKPTKELTDSNAKALIKAIGAGSKKAIDVRNSLALYKDNPAKSKVEAYLNTM